MAFHEDLECSMSLHFFLKKKKLILFPHIETIKIFSGTQKKTFKQQNRFPSWLGAMVGKNKSQKTNIFFYYLAFISQDGGLIILDMWWMLRCLLAILQNLRDPRENVAKHWHYKYISKWSILIKYSNLHSQFHD